MSKGKPRAPDASRREEFGWGRNNSASARNMRRLEAAGKSPEAADLRIANQRRMGPSGRR
jgi:hypothetical protein